MALHGIEGKTTTGLIKAMFKDGEKLPDTYEDWLAKAQITILTLAKDRLRVEKSYIDPETFPQWCVEKGLEMDASSRTHYAAELARAKHGYGHMGRLT